MGMGVFKIINSKPFGAGGFDKLTIFLWRHTIGGSPPGLDGPQKDQVGWRGYLNPKSGSPASILGSPAIYSKKAKRFFFPLIMLVMVVMLLGLFLEIRSPGRWDYAIC